MQGLCRLDKVADRINHAEGKDTLVLGFSSIPVFMRRVRLPILPMPSGVTGRVPITQHDGKISFR